MPSDCARMDYKKEGWHDLQKRVVTLGSHWVFSRAGVQVGLGVGIAQWQFSSIRRELIPLTSFIAREKGRTQTRRESAFIEQRKRK